MRTSDACELFTRCLAKPSGEPWRLFVAIHGRKVRRTVRLAARRCRAPMPAPDLDEMVQEVYCRLLSSRARFRGHSESDLWAFLGCVAYNLIVDRQRAATARKRLPRPRHSADPHLTPSRLDPEARLLGKERRRMFLEQCLAIARCDRVLVDLRALRLAFLEGWSSREIAHHLGSLSATQVDALVQRLRRHLAKQGIRLPRRCCVPVAVPAPG